MKILYIIPSLAGGGAEKLTNDLLPLFIEKQIECDLLIFSLKNEKYYNKLKDAGVNIIVLPRNISGHIAKILYIRKIVLKGNYSIVHANLFPTLYYCSIIKMFSRRFPFLVFTEHSTDNHRRHHKILRILEKKIYRRYDKIICISDGTYDSLKEWLHIKKDNNNKMCVVNNGVPIDLFFAAPKYDRKSFFGYSDEDIIICMVGSFTQHKNHNLMLEVMKMLPEKYKCVFVGEGPLLNDVKIKVETSELLKERIVFLGFREDVASIIKTSDISVIPSIFEGFGLVVVEAMACGNPVIASNVKGISSIVSNYGLLADPKDAISFVKQIERLKDKKEYDYYSSLSFERSNCFSIIQTSNNYIGIYKDLLEHKHV